MKAKKINRLLSALFGGVAGGIIVCAYAFSHPSLPKSKIVRIIGEHGMCSGEQVHSPSGADYILSAGHCRRLANASDMYTIKTEDGRKMQRKLIAEDPNSDLLLIEGVPGLRGLDLAESSYAGENITTLTHGDNLDTYMTKGVLIEMQRMIAPVSRIESEEDKKNCLSMPKNSIQGDGFGDYCCIDIFEVVSTALIVPGSSGGAVLDSHMDLVGIASSGNGTFGSFVSLIDIKSFLRNY